MKSLTIVFAVLVFAASVSFGAYTYVIGPGDKTSRWLFDHESLLMTGGELYSLDLNDWSSARIENTSPLISEGNGGIWQLNQGGHSSLEILGGEIHLLIAGGSQSSAIISGGRIDRLESRKNFFEVQKQITFICRDWDYNSTTKKLTGTWMDYSTFNIQLVNSPGYPPAIDNIAFIPEPVSLILFAAGAVLTRKHK